MTTGFDWVRNSPFPPPEFDRFRFQSLRQMLFSTDDDSERTRPVLIGAVDETALVVTLADLQAAACFAADWCRTQNLSPGERVVVTRLPYASELLTAVNAIALMANGINIVLSVDTSVDALRDLISRTQCRFLITAVEAGAAQHPTTRQALEDVDRVRIECGVPECGAPVDLPLSGGDENSHVLNTCGHSVDDDILIVTTSSTTGPAKLVRYTERALLTVAEAWCTAGLLSSETTGGTSICPLFSHTMGVRNVLHAIWTRRATLLIPPEWLVEAPHRVVALLQASPPRHFTGGPALIQALARLSHSVPEARRALKSLSVVVSSGSTWHDASAGLLPNVHAANAYGTSETQQVLSTLIPPHPTAPLQRSPTSASPCLGRPLPGVSVAVRWTDSQNQIGRLFVKSPFNAIGYLGQPEFPEWLETGDLVRVRDEELEFAGRGTDDFINLGVGLKISRVVIEQRYSFLTHEFSGIMFRHSPGRMGVVAIAFVGKRDPVDPQLRQRIQNLVAAFHDRLQQNEHDLDLRQTMLVALGLVRGEPPLTGLGKLDVARVAAEHSDVLLALDEPVGRHRQIVEMEQLPAEEDTWYEHMMPYAGQLMQALRLDVEFVDGDGDRLVAVIDGGRKTVLDLVGGFGANLLGHGRSDLAAVATEAIRHVPLLDQFSRRTPASQLARKLSDLLGSVTGRRYVCLFHSTGAEAVEAALQHALFRWEQKFHEWNDGLWQQYGVDSAEIVGECVEFNRRKFSAYVPLLLALQGGYHGKTSGALTVMADESRRLPFAALLGARVRFVTRSFTSLALESVRDVFDEEALMLRRPERRDGQTEIVECPFSGIIAAIAEPVQGEGGIFEIPMDWMQTVRDAQIPLIVDEIQCGLGRSGELPASSGVVANYYLLGKALGGGVAKISATLIDREDYCDDFDLQTGATFSGDAMSCRVAAKVIEIIDRDDVPRRAHHLGVRLRHALEAVHEAHPAIVRKITGRGAMLGVELGLPSDTQRFLAEMLRDSPGYFAASYLLHRHFIRVLPTLSAPSVLRIEPSAYLSDESIDQLANGLRDFSERIACSDAYGLLEHLIPASTLRDSNAIPEITSATPANSRSSQRLNFHFMHQRPVSGGRRVGFIFNPIYPTEELLVELPALRALAIDQRLELAQRIQVLLQLRPVELFSRNLFNDRVWLCGIILPASADTLNVWNRADRLKEVRQRLNEALELAASRGCETVVLGAQTSIVTANATTITPPPGVQVSSGNSFTVAAILAQLEAAIERMRLPRDSRIGVVGANGNIGSAIVRCLALPGRWDGPLLMVGRSGSLPRLTALRDQLAGHTGHARLEITQDLNELQTCNIIVVAVSGDGIVLHSQHVRASGDVLIADVSQPRAVSTAITRERSNATMVSAGLVRLPEDSEFRLTPHTPRGTCFACTAEALLMGLEPHAELRLRGEIDPHAVEVLLQLGRKYGLLSSPD